MSPNQGTEHCTIRSYTSTKRLSWAVANVTAQQVSDAAHGSGAWRAFASDWNSSPGRPAGHATFFDRITQYCSKNMNSGVATCGGHLRFEPQCQVARRTDRDALPTDLPESTSGVRATHGCCRPPRRLLSPCRSFGYSTASTGVPPAAKTGRCHGCRRSKSRPRGSAPAGHHCLTRSFLVDRIGFHRRQAVTTGCREPVPVP